LDTYKQYKIHCVGRTYNFLTLSLVVTTVKLGVKHHDMKMFEVVEIQHGLRWSSSVPEGCPPGAHWTGPRAGLGAVENRKMVGQIGC
jgi:hypothetical protein